MSGREKEEEKKKGCGLKRVESKITANTYSFGPIHNLVFKLFDVKIK